MLVPRIMHKHERSIHQWLTSSKPVPSVDKNFYIATNRILSPLPKHCCHPMIITFLLLNGAALYQSTCNGGSSPPPGLFHFRRDNRDISWLLGRAIIPQESRLPRYRTPNQLSENLQIHRTYFFGSCHSKSSSPLLDAHPSAL